MKKILIGGVLAAGAVVGIAAGVTAYAWNARDTNDARRAARKEASRTLREKAAKDPAGVVPYLQRLVTEKETKWWFEGSDGRFFDKADSLPMPWQIRRGEVTKVPLDYTAQLAEDAIIKFAGDGTEGSENVEGLKSLIAFADTLMPSLAEGARTSLQNRQLDAFFLTKNYDAAIALLEKGVPGKTMEWCKSTAIKLRAHKAMDAKDFNGAITHFLAFCDYMKTDEQKDFEECDPTTGILYSREWVLAFNYKRCANLARESGDAKRAAEFLAEAKKYYKPALEKAKDDAKSLEALKKETQDLGL